jgi:hypothetical protein
MPNDLSEALEHDWIESKSLFDIQLAHPRYHTGRPFGAPNATWNKFHDLRLEVNIFYRRHVFVVPLTK